MPLYLVRHAHAGARRADGRDRYRPLSPDGQAQAQALVAAFTSPPASSPSRRPVELLWSSPATRCAQTLGPLSRATGLEVVEQVNLGEGADTVAALADLDRMAPGDRVVVACSHGDVIPAVIDQLLARGAEVRGRACELASVWRLDQPGDDGRWGRAHYLGPTPTDLG